MPGFDFPDVITVIERQIQSYVSNASAFGTIYPSFLQQLKTGFVGGNINDAQMKFWDSVIRIQIQQLQEETGNSILDTGRQIGAAYEAVLAQYGLSLKLFKDSIPSDLATLLGFKGTTGIIPYIKNLFLELMDFKPTGLLNAEELTAASAPTWVIPAGVASVLGVAAVALPVYLYLRNKINETNDYIDNINYESSKTLVVFKNRKSVVLDATDKQNPKIIEYGPPLDLNAPLGSEANPVTAATIGQLTKPHKAKKIVLKPTANELTNLALTEVAKVLNALPSRLSFELSTKTNPADQSGTVLEGKYIVLQVSLKTGQTAKHTLTTIPLRPLRVNEKPFTTAEEAPVEAEIMKQVAQLAGSDGTGAFASPIQPTGQAGTASTPTQKLGTGRFGKVGNDVYEIMLNGTYRHVGLTEFKAIGLNINILPVLPPPPATSTIQPGQISDPTSLPLLDKLQFYNMELVYANGGLVLYERGDTHHSSGVHGILNPDNLITTLGIDKTKLKTIGGDVDRLAVQGYNFSTSKANFSAGDFVTYVGQYDQNWRNEHPTPSAPPNLGITPNQIKFPYVRFKGSPDTFDRLTGRHIPHNEAVAKGILTKGVIEQLTTTRPEVQVATDFSLWSGKDLRSFPV